MATSRQIHTPPKSHRGGAEPAEPKPLAAAFISSGVIASVPRLAGLAHGVALAEKMPVNRWPAAAGDRIVKALREGKKAEALRLIAQDGVWMPFRDPGYFDTESCFPIFSSLELIPRFLRQIDDLDGVDIDAVKAHQVGAEFFAACPHLDEILTLNPGSESEWRLSAGDYRTLAGYEEKQGESGSRE